MLAALGVVSKTVGYKPEISAARIASPGGARLAQPFRRVGAKRPPTRPGFVTAFGYPSPNPAVRIAARGARASCLVHGLGCVPSSARDPHRGRRAGWGSRPSPGTGRLPGPRTRMASCRSRCERHAPGRARPTRRCPSRERIPVASDLTGERRCRANSRDERLRRAQPRAKASCSFSSLPVVSADAPWAASRDLRPYNKSDPWSASTSRRRRSVVSPDWRRLRPSRSLH